MKFAFSGLLLLSFACTHAQNLSIGPAFGWSIPVTRAYHSDIDRPPQGGVIGVSGVYETQIGTTGLYFETGLNVRCFYFNNSIANYGSEPTAPIGLSFGVPLKLQGRVRFDNISALKIGAGLIPLVETGQLARTTESDGAVRPNIAPTAHLGILVYNNYSLGFNWFVPLRHYGSAVLQNRFYLHTATFDILYKIHRKPKPKTRR